MLRTGYPIPKILSIPLCAGFRPPERRKNGRFRSVSWPELPEREKIFKKAIFIFLILWYDTNECAAAWDLRRPGGLSGCFFRAPADLYQSPEQSADYLSLTQTIRNAKNALSQEYGVEVEDISVMSGNNTALIQLQDMDGDGATETAVTFFRVPDADRPLKIYFFTKSDEDTYTASAVVEGTGSSIYRVDYVDLNGNGTKEVVVSWQMNTGAYLLGAYSLEEVMNRNVQQAAVSSSASGAAAVPKQDALRAEEWMTTAYTEYALYDLDQDTRTEIAVIQVDPAGTRRAPTAQCRSTAGGTAPL